MCGGYTQTWRDALDDEIKLAIKHKQDVEAQLEKKFEVYEPLEVRTQVVAGTNYMINVKTDNNEKY